jgi:hypothetical protein
MALPECHSRRFLEHEEDVYFCAHPRMHARDSLVSTGVCMVCDYWRESPPAEYRPFPPPKPRGPCVYLGGLTRLRECPGCRGTVKVKVYACGHPAHGETTLAECTACRDFEPRPDDPPRA